MRNNIGHFYVSKNRIIPFIVDVIGYYFFMLDDVRVF